MPARERATVNCDNPSRTRYVIEKCRCDACRAEAAAYQREWSKRKALGVECWVSGALVRQHIAVLKANGMSNKEIRRAAQISAGVLTNVYYRHWRTGKPVERVKKATADRILAVNRRHYSKGQQVSREAMDRRIVEMLADGYSIAAQSRISGVDRQVLDRYKDPRRKTVSAERLVRYMKATEAQLGEWNSEPDAIARKRSENASEHAAKIVARKWGAESGILRESIGDGFSYSYGGKTIEATAIRVGKARKTATVNGKRTVVYRVGDREIAGAKAARDYAEDYLMGVLL